MVKALGNKQESYQKAVVDVSKKHVDSAIDLILLDFPVTPVLGDRPAWRSRVVGNGVGCQRKDVFFIVYHISSA